MGPQNLNALSEGLTFSTTQQWSSSKLLQKTVHHAYLNAVFVYEDKINMTACPSSREDRVYLLLMQCRNIKLLIITVDCLMFQSLLP